MENRREGQSASVFRQFTFSTGWGRWCQVVQSGWWMAGQVGQGWLFLAVVYFAQATAVRVITREKKKVLKWFHLLSEFYNACLVQRGGEGSPNCRCWPRGWLGACSHGERCCFSLAMLKCCLDCEHQPCVFPWGFVTDDEHHSCCQAVSGQVCFCVYIVPSTFFTGCLLGDYTNEVIGGLRQCQHSTYRSD